MCITDQQDSSPKKGLYINEFYQFLKLQESQALLSKAGGHFYRQRKLDADPVLSQIKERLGCTPCNLRGKRKVKIDLGLVLMSNNLKKLCKKMG